MNAGAQSREGMGPDRAWYWLALFLFLLALAAAVLWIFERHAPNRPVTYADPLEEFKYGSVGTDMDRGLPLDVLAALPRVFPEYLPDDESPRDYRAFGFIQEDGQPMPIGFSVRRRFVDLTAPNCALCHTGLVITPEQPGGQIIPGMPANTVDLQAFFRFLFRCAQDWRFNPDCLLAEMGQIRALDAVDKTLYQFIIPLFRSELLARQAMLATYFGDSSTHPRWGPGRVDTFNTFKFDQFASLYQGETIAEDELYGTVALPPIWAQGKRDGLWLHWDGNNDSVRERNFSAALAAGATPENLDEAQGRLFALEEWLKIGLDSPPFPFPIDRELAARGEPLYRRYCFDCHAFEGKQVGQVTPLEEIGTDRGRLDSYTEKFRQIQREYTKDHEWAFTHFRKTGGYTNLPLDGLWARAPYLHNGSVPTLWDLLQPEEERPQTFYAGDIRYEPQKVGFHHENPTAPDGRSLMLLDTSERGNGNQGHSGTRYGTELTPEDKLALIEYLKTL